MDRAFITEKQLSLIAINAVIRSEFTSARIADFGSIEKKTDADPANGSI